MLSHMQFVMNACDQPKVAGLKQNSQGLIDSEAFGYNYQFGIASTKAIHLIVIFSNFLNMFSICNW